MNVIRRALALTAILCALLPTIAYGDDHANVARGFNSEGAFQISDVDSINMFSGNLIVDIPIGQTYHVGGDLSYALRLVYNGQLWSYTTEGRAIPSRANVALGWQISLGDLQAPDAQLAPLVDSQQTWSFIGPDAGRHTFYQVLHKEELGTEYEALHDASHVLGYTRDGSVMRLVHEAWIPNENETKASRVVRVEMPNGLIYKFRSTEVDAANEVAQSKAARYFLTEVRDRYDNVLEVQYWWTPEQESIQCLRWNPEKVEIEKLVEHPVVGEGRIQTITFANEYWQQTPAYSIAATYQRDIKQIELTSKGTSKVVYQFNTLYDTMGEPCDSRRGVAGDHRTAVRTLTAVTGPDGFRYDFLYNRFGPTGGDGPIIACTDTAGHLSQMKLPTGGFVDYELTRRSFPQTPESVHLGSWEPIHEGSPAEGMPPFANPVAVKTRTISDGHGDVKTWDYSTIRGCWPFGSDESAVVRPQVLLVDVKDPEGTVTRSHFTTDLVDDVQTTGFPGTLEDYGLPYNRGIPLAGETGYYLSTEVLDSACAIPQSIAKNCTFSMCDGHVMRRTYVKYEYEPYFSDQWDQPGGPYQNGGNTDLNRRLAGTITVMRRYDSGSGVWVDDNTCGTAQNQLCYTKVEYSDYDALGHYRNETRSTNMGGEPRTTTTSYDPLYRRGATHAPFTYVIGSANDPVKYLLREPDPWMTGFYRDVTVQEGDGGPQLIAKACWELATAFLNRKFMYRDDNHAVLAIFTHDGNGNLNSESYSLHDGGGDVCAAAPTSSETKIIHAWESGSLATSKYQDFTFFTRRFAIDSGTGLATSSFDAKGRETKYDYDGLGRLKFVKPPHAMWLSYDYDIAAKQITATQFAASDVNGTAALGETHFYYDHLGRLIQTRRLMPEGFADETRTLLTTQWSTSAQTYDSAGRKKTVSVAKYENNPDFSSSFSAPVTSFVYDDLGRTISTTAPDGALATAEYIGGRTVRKTVKVASSLSDPSGPIIQTPFTTTETYDGFGRLASVEEAIDGAPVTDYQYDFGDRLARVTSGVQVREFHYDRSGLLVDEKHPESEKVEYGYDARSHMLTRKTGTLFSLKYAYDDAERLTTVTDDQNSTLLKQFEYDSYGAVSEPGRIVRQSRINPFGAQQYVVSDSFQYDDAGRISNKTTSVTTPTGAKSFSQDYNYNDQDQLSEIDYPVCANCPNLLAGARNVPLEWTNGLLTAVPGAANRIEYAASGAVTRVEHYAANAPTGVVDRFEQDPSGMPRPARITVQNVVDCLLITKQPVSKSIIPNDNVKFSIEVAAGATVQWYRGQQGDMSVPVDADPGTGLDYTTPALTTTTYYWARVTKGTCIENSVTVAANVCQVPAILTPAADVTTTTTTGKVPLDFSVGVNFVSGSEIIWYSKVGSELPKEIGRGLSIRYTPTVFTTAEDPLLIIAVATNTCGSVPRTVARLVVVGQPCVAQWIAQLPTKTVSVMPLEAMAMKVRLEWVAGATYSFRWYENGALLQSDEHPASATFSLIDSDYIFRVDTQATLRVDAWINCADGQKSEIVTSKSYGILYGRCPIPEVTLDQTSVVATDKPVVITADVPWPDATFQWYDGETGNTHHPLGYATTNVLTADPVAGTYWLRVSTDCGTHTDTPTVRISTASCQPVRITREPQDANTDAGADVVLSVDAQGDPSPSRYTWHQNNVPIPDDGGRPTLTVRPLRTSDYYVRVTNGNCHIAESRIARVHVTSCGSITMVAQPQDVAVAAGTPLHLGVRATATLPLHYQWYEGESGDTTHPVGTDDDDFDLNNPVTTKYWVRLYFADPALCAVDSRTANVNVCSEAVITRYPGPDIVSSAPGVRQAFDVGVSGSNVTYRWYEGVTTPQSTDYSKPLNSTSNALAVSPQVTTSYFVKVTTACSPHSGDDFVNVPVRVSVCPNITEPPTATKTLIVSGTTTTLSIINIDRGDEIQWFTRAANGTVTRVTSMGGHTTTTPPLTETTTFFARAISGYCQRDSEPITITICSSPIATFDASSITKVEKDQQFTLIAGVRPSDGVASYAWYRGSVAGDVANSTLISTTSNVLNTTISQTMSYWVRATTPDGCYDDTPVHTVQVCIPKITSQPQSITIAANTNTTLTVVADVTSTYQWYKGQPGDTSQPIAGQTGSSINVTPATDTTYWVRVTGSCQVSKDSAAATVTICQPPQITAQPSSQSIAYSYTVYPAVTATGTDLTYQWYKGLAGDTSMPIAGATSSSVSVTPTVTTDYWVKITGHCGAVNSATAKISVAPTITTQPVGGPITKGTTRTLTVAASGTQLTYQWIQLVGSTENVIAGATAASYTTPAIQSDAMYFCRVKSGNATKDSSVATLSVCLARTIRIVGTPNKVSGSSVTLTVDDASADETYYWYRGASGDTSNSIGQGVTRTVSPLETTLYWARTHTASCDADSAELTVRICYPAITTQPQSATIASGTTRQLTVAATGTPTMTYQWYVGAPGNTGSPISGATSASYTTPALTSTTSYWARVSCPSTGCTSSWTDSAGATVTVCQPPAITTHPGPHITVKNDSLTLNVVATGDGLHYQWYEGATGDTSHPVGTDSASYTFTTSTTKYFWVRVTGTCGTADSNAAQQSIYPTINGQPQAATICGLGSSATFSVNASGAESYQWWRQVTGQTKVAVGTTASVSVPIAQVPVQVWVDVTSGLATTSSTHVGVSVNPVPTVNSFTSTVDNAQGTRFLLQANIAAADQGLVKFKFYQGPLGDTSTLLYDGTAYYFRVTPASHPITYWVRVYYIDTGCPTDRAVTIP